MTTATTATTTTTTIEQKSSKNTYPPILHAFTAFTYSPNVSTAGAGEREVGSKIKMFNFNFFNHNNRDEVKNKISRTILASKYLVAEKDDQCQLCGDRREHDQLSQLWIDDLPLAKTCAECISMIQLAIKNTRKRKLIHPNL